jgi:hypothetical protein
MTIEIKSRSGTEIPKRTTKRKADPVSPPASSGQAPKASKADQAHVLAATIEMLVRARIREERFLRLGGQVPESVTKDIHIAQAELPKQIAEIL